MPNKWAYFAMGIMSGLILVLGYALLMSAHDNRAWAAQSVDSNSKFVLAVGGSQQGINDIVWVLHEHPPHPGLKTREEDNKVLKNSRISLCLYKAARNGEAMKLMAARDIAYDVEFMDFNQEKPTVREIIETLSKQIKKE